MKKLPPWTLSLGAVAAVTLFFQLAVGRVLDSLWFARPSDVIVLLGEWFASGSVYPHIVTTLTEIAIGFALGVGAAIVLAVALSSNALLARVAMPLVIAAYSLPKVALIPFFIFTLGVGIESKVAQVALNVVFIVFLNLYTGLTTINPRLRESLALMGASPFEILLKVKLPSALAWLLSGMRISARYALAGAVAVELLSSNRGLGFLIAKATAQLEPAPLFATLVILAVLGFALTYALQVLENRVLAWRV
jgi:NitT/TauT family transport system permease protein